MTTTAQDFYNLIEEERDDQRETWRYGARGEPPFRYDDQHDEHHTPFEWLSIIRHYTIRLNDAAQALRLAEMGEWKEGGTERLNEAREKFERERVKLAAVVTAWYEADQRKAAKAEADRYDVDR